MTSRSGHAASVGGAAATLIKRLDTAPSLEHLHGLAIAWREVLLLASDGRRQLADFESRLAVLDERFAVVLKRPDAAAGSASTAATAPAGGAKAVPSPANDDERLEMARNFMCNTLDAFVGLAASSLISRVEASQQIDELRHLFGDWRDAIALTNDGRKRLGELQVKLAALLS